ncbi:hypothetical protein D3C78_1208230 [compost metagenome]
MTESHGVDVDVVAPPLLGQRLGHAEDAGLGRGIVGLPGVATGGDRGNVDHLAVDHTAFGGFLLGQGADDRLGGTQDAERCGQVAVDDGVPLLVAHLLDHVVPGVAGVVDDDVDAAVVLDSSLDEAIGEIDSGDTADAGHGFAASGADLGNHFFSRAGIQVIDHHTGAIARQFQRDAATDATTGTGDQGDFAFKFFHCHCLLIKSGCQCVRSVRPGPRPPRPPPWLRHTGWRTGSAGARAFRRRPRISR